VVGAYIKLSTWLWYRFTGVLLGRYNTQWDL